MFVLYGSGFMVWVREWMVNGAGLSVQDCAMAEELCTLGTKEQEEVALDALTSQR